MATEKNLLLTKRDFCLTKNARVNIIHYSGLYVETSRLGKIHSFIPSSKDKKNAPIIPLRNNVGFVMKLVTIFWKD